MTAGTMEVYKIMVAVEGEEEAEGTARVAGLPIRTVPVG
jgi:hypothetical protein